MRRDTVLGMLFARVSVTQLSKKVKSRLTICVKPMWRAAERGGTTFFPVAFILMYGRCNCHKTSDSIECFIWNHQVLICNIIKEMTKDWMEELDGNSGCGSYSSDIITTVIDWKVLLIDLVRGGFCTIVWCCNIESFGNGIIVS